MKELHMVPMRIGQMDLTDEVDVADPGMDRGTYNRIGIAPGLYYCTAYVEEANGRKPSLADKVWICQIVRAEDYNCGKTSFRQMATPEAWERVSTVNVYSGMAGFFSNKPNFTDKEWDAFCKKLTPVCSHTLSGSNDHNDISGFFTTSGDGDGSYPVYAIRKRGKIVALEIRFYESEI